MVFDLQRKGCGAMRFLIFFKRCYRILKRTGMLHVFSSFLLFLAGASAILAVIEPGIVTWGDGIWYCFVSATTIGFGDICVTTRIGRIITILVSVYGILMTAMVPGVVVNYYMEYLEIRKKETVSLFFEKLEKLPELSQEELAELSKQIKELDRKLRI